MKKKRIIPYLIIFIISGLIYVGLENLWRGRSHYTMFFCAGFAGLLIAAVNDEILSFEDDFFNQAFVATFFCTMCEFIFGLVFNMDYSIWDYRGLWGTLEWTCSQVNILFIGVWFIISALSIPFLDWLEWKLGLEPKPYYRFGSKYWYPYGNPTSNTPSS